MRLDVYLKSARLFVRRTEAQRQIDSGSVLLNGTRTKPAHAVAPGDLLLIRYPRHELELEVLNTPPGKVTKAAAPCLYRLIRRMEREES